MSCKSNSEDTETTEISAAQPNIVFIMTDDHAYQAISAYGSSLIETPNIDRIANEGALMRQARVTNSICSPSRAVLLTGKYSHKNGMKDNGTYFNTDQPTFPKLLRKNGYKTAMIGKWHLFSEPTGFDYWNILPDQGHYYNPEFRKMGEDTIYKGYVTDVITDLSLDWIEKNKSEPFCLMIQHKAPHRNWMPPLKYLNSFEDTQFELPDNFYDDYQGRKALDRSLTTIQHGQLDVRYDSKIPCDTCKVTEINSWAPAEWQREIERLTPEEKEKWDEGYKEEYASFKNLKTEKEFIEWQYQRFMEDYLRCIKSVDDNVGRVLKYLEKEGLAENTIVVYMSDQGFYLGEHGLYDKRFMYEESFRTPMMIRYPKKINARQNIGEPTLNLDVAPTFLDYAGVSIPEDMQGTSMRGLLDNEEDDPEWRSDVYYHYYEKSFGATAHYGIKTNRYKLIHFYDPINTWELYDLKKDPKEMENLYEDHEYSNIVIELKQRLIKLQQQYDDQEGLELNSL
jgi:arylsulfatase A-like enzyme